MHRLPYKVSTGHVTVGLSELFSSTVNRLAVRDVNNTMPKRSVDKSGSFYVHTDAFHKHSEDVRLHAVD